MDLSILKNKRILIVEDDFTNRELINEIFDDLGTEVVNVTTGNKAIEICKTDEFDMILMDIQLPGMNGFDATKAIKKIKPDIHIIAQTAFAYDADRFEAIEAGCSDYIAKPFRRDELLKLVLKYI